MKTNTQSAFTLAEVLVAGAATLLIAAALLSGTVALQRCFVATESYAVAQADQMRVSDYMALDIRRALPESRGGLTNSVETNTNGNILRVKILSYDPLVDPTLVDDAVVYPGSLIEVTYFQNSDKIYRRETLDGVTTTELVAEKVADFVVSPQLLQDSVITTIKFQPKFSNSDTDNSGQTTLTNKTLIRNNL